MPSLRPLLRALPEIELEVTGGCLHNLFHVGVVQIILAEAAKESRIEVLEGADSRDKGMGRRT